MSGWNVGSQEIFRILTRQGYEEAPDDKDGDNRRSSARPIAERCFPGWLSHFGPGASRYHSHEIRVPPTAWPRPLQIRHWSSSAVILLRSADFGLRQDGVRELPFSRAWLGGNGFPQPQRFRQADLAQIADADRIALRRQRSVRLGRPQCQPGGASQIVDRHRFHVDAGDRHAGQGRSDRGADQVQPGLCRQVQSGIARIVHQHRLPLRRQSPPSS